MLSESNRKHAGSGSCRYNFISLVLVLHLFKNIFMSSLTGYMSSHNELYFYFFLKYFYRK